jgi:hypothetical protein
MDQTLIAYTGGHGVMTSTAKPIVTAKAIGRTYRVALKRIAEFAALYGESNRHTKTTINDAMKWSADYAHDLATQELKALKWEIEVGNDSPAAIIALIDDRIKHNSREGRSKQ